MYSVKRPCKDQIVVDAQLVQTFVKVSLVDQPPGFVDYYQGKHDHDVDIIGGLMRLAVQLGSLHPGISER